MQNQFRILPVVAVFALGCVGTDFIEEPVVFTPARIAISPSNAAVEVGKATGFQAVYYESLDNPVANTTFQWFSSNANIADIDANGRASGIQPGQLRITAHARNITSAPALLTVVANANQVARVIVTPERGQVSAGGTLQFIAVAHDINDNVLSGKTVTSAEGVESSPAHLTVSSASRSGTFTKRPGGSYNVSGKALLTQESNGSLRLSFDDAFRSSNGPGLEVFLSASNTVGVNSRNLGRLQRTSGAQSYAVPAGVTLTTYDWVIVHCVPFNVTFGYARLQ
jgi:hypothetical protein